MLWLAWLPTQKCEKYAEVLLGISKIADITNHIQIDEIKCVLVRVLFLKILIIKDTMTSLVDDFSMLSDIILK